MSDITNEPKNLTEFQKYAWGKLSEEANEMMAVINETTRIRESDFRRRGVPILSGLLDETFDESQWLAFVGNQTMEVWVCQDTNPDDVILKIPPLLGSLHVVLPTEDQPSVSEEAMMMEQELQVMPSQSHEARLRFMTELTDTIEAQSARDLAIRDKLNIDAINRVFEYYGIAGRLHYPVDIEAVEVPTELKEKGTTNAPASAKTDFSQGEDF